MAAYAIKAEVGDTGAREFAFAAHKTMYGGKRIVAGDTVYLFASENSGGGGLFARGIATAAEAVPPDPDLARQTPRVNVRVRRTATAARALGRAELKPHDDWNDGSPQSELNFKFYRQATDKVVGLSDAAARFLDGYFPAAR